MRVNSSGRAPGWVRIATAVTLLATLITAVTLVSSSWHPRRTSYVAYFANTNGLYTGDEVRILGVAVGTIDKIEPQPDTARVTFSVDARYPVPADVKAAILSPSLVSARAIQLVPAYSGGPTLAAGQVIPQERTAVPVEWDDFRAQLEKLTDSLQPTVPGGPSPLGEFINTAAANLRGQGDTARETVIKLSQATSALGDHSTDIFSTVRNLQLLVSALSSSSDLLADFNTNLADVTNVLSNTPGEIASATTGLDAAVRDLRTFVAENRDGLLYVFLPPTDALEDFVDLVARLEAAAAKVGCAVVVEGYGPPSDARLVSMSITPDPGVIEVNVAPSASFAEQRDQLNVLYAEARKARLSTESFDFDGTHGGTGGGNHITLGGLTPADSPLLRRPDLLVSLLTYWQRHPALSYLFAGRFIGTTSQAPRVDEGRSEALYELEIAFAEIARLTSSGAPRPGHGRSASVAPEHGRSASVAPWVTDRALRHLLTDITGNTHRAEFCIDKLYSPDSPRGRLGILELRGFEMPPHFQMAMVQSLLVRSLVARFWDEPLRAPLIRHGLNLHGRYLLPHFIIHDIADVAADLRAHDIDFDTSWLDPFTEFRFPRIGTAVFDHVEIELRGAIEPWNTLGEESTAGGTARYVDSSVERIQVRTIGADRQRHVVTCNGHPIPMLATDNPDVQVGGVRYRAWQPPSALHPTITVDSPLRFELVDIATGASRGGCTYHVSHPGGRAYDSPPVNAVEAESRRGRRFEATGFTPGNVDVANIREKQARQSIDVGAPGILDLRRVRTVLQN